MRGKSNLHGYGPESIHVAIRSDGRVLIPSENSGERQRARVIAGEPIYSWQARAKTWQARSRPNDLDRAATLGLNEYAVDATSSTWFP